MSRNFREMLEKKWAEDKHVCPGLDSVDADRMCKIVDQTHDLACTFKPNLAFYIARLEVGITALRRVIDHIHAVAEDVPIILDCKDADIDNTNNGYVQMIESLGVDAITTNPYLGQEALSPFLSRKDMGVFVLCKTSNKGAGEFQDLHVDTAITDRNIINVRLQADAYHSIRLYQYVAYKVATEWNKNGNCGLVAGGTYPHEVGEVRDISGDLPILIPGIGAQGGDLGSTIKAVKKNFIINSSRGIINAKDPPAEMKKLHDGISQYHQ